MPKTGLKKEVMPFHQACRQREYLADRGGNQGQVGQTIDVYHIRTKERDEKTIF